MNVLLSTEMQQCSCVFVTFCLHNFPKHFLQPCTGHEGACPTTEVFLERIGLCQSGRFSTLAVRLCPHVTPHAADTTPRLPAIHVPALCTGTQCQHTVFCCLTSAYHGGHAFFLSLSSFSSFFCWIFGSSASIPLGLVFFCCWEMRGAHIFFHCWLSAALEKVQASCHLLLLALIVPTASDLHMGIWLFTLWARSPHQSGKEDPQRTLAVCSALFRVFGWPQMEFWKGLDE